jgi:hypothetical protein
VTGVQTCALPISDFLPGVFEDANGLAFDRANNLWAVSHKAGLVAMFPNSGGVISATAAFTTSALPQPFAVAVDTFGNVYVSNVDLDAQPGNGSLWKFHNLGSAEAPSVSPEPLFLQSGVDLTSLAFDSTGKLWGADFNASQLVALSSAELRAAQQFAVAHGTVTYYGPKTGTYFVVFSTDPYDIEFSDEGTRFLSLGGSPTYFDVPNLLAPNTYYALALLDTNGDGHPDGFDPMGAYIRAAAPQPPAPIFVGENADIRGLEIQLLDHSAAAGTITNDSRQLGEMHVLAWYGNPGEPGATVMAEEHVGPAEQIGRAHV